MDKASYRVECPQLKRQMRKEREGEEHRGRRRRTGRLRPEEERERERLSRDYSGYLQGPFANGRRKEFCSKIIGCCFMMSNTIIFNFFQIPLGSKKKTHLSIN